MMEVEDIDNLSRNQDIAVGLQVILKPRVLLQSWGSRKTGVE